MTTTTTAPSAPTDVGPELDDLVEAGWYPTSSEGFEHGLVVLAMGSHYWLVPGADGHRLLVASGVAEAVRGQLALFDRESIGWPPCSPRADPVSPYRAGLFGALVWALALLAGFAAQSKLPGWMEAGAMDARAVFAEAELWRPATALFLHADTGHLVSNLVGGVFLFAAVFSTMGLVCGGGLLALASVAGNVAAAAVHHPGDYRSVGASTALFAALGLLTGRAVRSAMRSRSARSGRALFVPLAAGLTVLALFGAGEQRVDVLAHATGFAAGLALGVAVADSGVTEPGRAG